MWSSRLPCRGKVKTARRCAPSPGGEGGRDGYHIMTGYIYIYAYDIGQHWCTGCGCMCMRTLADAPGASVHHNIPVHMQLQEVQMQEGQKSMKGVTGWRIAACLRDRGGWHTGGCCGGAQVECAHHLRIIVGAAGHHADASRGRPPFPRCCPGKQGVQLPLSKLLLEGLYEPRERVFLQSEDRINAPHVANACIKEAKGGWIGTSEQLCTRKLPEDLHTVTRDAVTRVA